jgi:sugar phosphate isomerase/epimerase
MKQDIWFSCADYAWPKLNHKTAIGLIKGMEFEAVDLGLFYGSTHIKPEDVARNVEAHADAIKKALSETELKIGDVFLIPGQDLSTRAPNNPSQKEVAEAFELFSGVCKYASLIGASGVTVLPGIIFSGQTQSEAINQSAKTLRRYVDLASTFDLEVSFEPHDGSCTPTPETAMQLVTLVNGLKITLDSAHFEYGGYPVSSYTEIFPSVRHVQIRGARTGVMQAIAEENETDYDLIVKSLVESNYRGGIACEYVWTEGWDCKRVDNVSETVLTRDYFRDSLRKVNQ